jgi:hypothetical protein
MGSNPFDFSDFGGPSAPPSGPPAGPGPQGTPAGPGGFDPWANAPARTPAPGHHGAGTGHEFGAPDPAGFDFSGGQDAFGQSVAAPAGFGTLTTTGPPLVWFAVAAGLAIVGALAAGLGALGGPSIATGALGWLLAGPVAIGALAVFNRVDTRRRTEAIYAAPTWVSTVYWVVLALCIVGIAIGAWQIALWAGTL